MRIPGRRRRDSESGENPFWITYSDLLSSLVMVFLVLLLAFQALAEEQMAQVLAAKERVDQEKKQSEGYRQRAIELGLDENAESLEKLIQELEGLQRQFPELDIQKTTGEARIDDKILFDTGKAELKPTGKALLRKVIPKWAAIVTKPEYQEIIKEVVFEGHADPQGALDQNENYLQNLQLTQRRSAAVAQFVFSSQCNFDQKDELRTLVSASGRSNVEAVRESLNSLRQKYPNATESELRGKAYKMASSKSRRVCLRLTFVNPLLRWKPDGETGR